jgi:hypothetical protein
MRCYSADEPLSDQRADGRDEHSRPPPADPLRSSSLQRLASDSVSRTPWHNRLMASERKKPIALRRDGPVGCVLHRELVPVVGCEDHAEDAAGDVARG